MSNPEGTLKAFSYPAIKQEKRLERLTDFLLAAHHVARGCPPELMASAAELVILVHADSFLTVSLMDISELQAMLGDTPFARKLLHHAALTFPQLYAAELLVLSGRRTRKNRFAANPYGANKPEAVLPTPFFETPVGKIQQTRRRIDALVKTIKSHATLSAPPAA